MNNTQILSAVLAATIATGAPVMAVAAYAQTPPTVAGTEPSQTATGETAVLANAKITMAQAIAAAELSAGGKLGSSASLWHRNLLGQANPWPTAIFGNKFYTSIFKCTAKLADCRFL